MKKVLVFLLSILSDLSSDMPPENGYHLNIQNTYISNISEYSDYEIIACVVHIGIEPMGCYKISNNQKIEKGYKYNTIYLTAIPKKSLEKLGDIQARNLDDLEKANSLSLKISQYLIDKNFDTLKTVNYIYIEDKYPISQEDYFYKIENIEKDKVKLKLQKRVITFTNGRNTSVIEY